MRKQLSTMAAGASESQLVFPAHSTHQGTLHRVVRNSAVLMLAVGLSAILNLATTFAMARALGRDALGEYFKFFTGIAVIQILLEAGIATLLTRRLSQSADSRAETIAEGAGILALAASATLTVWLGFGAAWCAWHEDWSGLLLFLAAGIACTGSQITQFCAAVFRADEQFEYESLARVLQAGSFAALVIGLVRRDSGGFPAALAYLAVSHVLAGAYLGGSLIRKQGFIRPRLGFAIIRKWYAEAVHVGLLDLVRRLTLEVDNILLSWLQPAAVLGIYSIAYRPLGPLNFIPTIILSALFPGFARMAIHDPEALKQAFARSIRILWVLALPIAVGTFICAEPIVLILAGPEYLEAARPLRVLIWINCCSFLSMQFRFLFTAVGRQRVLTILAFLTLAYEAGLEIILIPHLSYMGACTASLTGEILFTALGLLVCRQMGFGAIPWRRMWRAMIAALIMGAVLWPARTLSIPLVILAGMGASGLYLGLCVLLGALPWEEVEKFLKVLTALGERLIRRLTVKQEPAEVVEKV